MSEQFHPDQELQTSQTYIDRIGPVLVAVREQHGLTVEDISQRLRLSIRQILALESDDFAVLPEAVITRGFIRNYARLLQIDAAPLLEVYSRYTPAQNSQAISIPSANVVISTQTATSWRPFAWFCAGLALLLCGWAFYADLFSRPGADIATGPETQLSADAAMDAGTIAREHILPSAPDEPVTAQQGLDTVPAPSASEAPAVAESSAPALPAENPSAVMGPTLKFSSTAESWVSVTDASGKQVLNKILPANSEETVEGKPPFRIVVGNANATRLEYNSNPVDLAPYTKVTVARLTLE
ncbi:cytoskeleton protein RodZ [Methylobacillus rhizosphaerae]|uniref:Cytoskeleton protein RodZ n=1 Tax=Methylobacillus rhizosphaerae TaxID=551994 RepID=A0A238YKQ3_9PROT|nr:RodZ domain-containing protein [Methylobacillus rhizosphaerae]SNR71707.1 cytoskeleton protein RodZ [Methylobacillus rhizosphaerae]